MDLILLGILYEAVLKARYKWQLPLSEKFADTEFILVCIFQYSVQIRKNKDHKKIRIWTIFTYCLGKRP